jgi:hypothetical protein
MIMQDVAGQKTNLNIYTTRPEAVTLPRTFYRKEKVSQSPCPRPPTKRRRRRK